MNDNNNDDFYKRIINEATILEGQNTFKWGSTFILVLAILSFFFVTATAYSFRELLTPFDWVILLSDSVVLFICGIFARKGQMWAFIVPIAIYAITFIQTIAAGQWAYAIMRAGIVIALSIALKKVIDQKRAAKEMAMRQIFQ